MKTLTLTFARRKHSQPGTSSPGNELAPVLLDVHDSWGKLGTITVTSRTGIISATYKKLIKEILKTIDPLYF